MSIINIGVFQQGPSVGPAVFVGDPANPNGGSWKINNPQASGSATATFGAGPPATEAVLVTIADGGVSLGSSISANVGTTQDRDADEMELDPVDVLIGAIAPGRSFTVTLIPQTIASRPHGTYTIYWTRS